MFHSIQRWFVDGSVKCFTGGHLPLAIMAMVILLFYLLLVTVLTAVVLKTIKVSVYYICSSCVVLYTHMSMYVYMYVCMYGTA